MLREETYATFTYVLKDVLDRVPDRDIGLTRYAIFDEAYRETLNNKIIERYWNQEIGLPTISQFTFNLRRKMTEIMPLYNKLYLSERISFDPLSTIDLKTISTNDTDQTTESDSLSGSDSDNDSTSFAVMSDTPQTMLAGNEDYATAGNHAKAKALARVTATDLTKATAIAKQKGDSHMTGYQGVASDLLMRYRDSLLNIDLMILDELRPLFMMVIGNGDNRTDFNTIERWTN